MAGKVFSLKPVDVPRVETSCRRIITPLPVPESVPILEKLREVESRSMQGQPPILWHKAQGVLVHDRWGNRWLDFSSGVLVTNVGHGRTRVIEAIARTAQLPLVHHYCFPSEERAALAAKLAELAPEPLKKVFLLTTGSEATECAFKLARTFGQSISPRKIDFVSFSGSFHGRTLGAQMIGGNPALKSWIPQPDTHIHAVPFPGDFRTPDPSFGVFERTLEKAGVEPGNVCGVISETFQGAGANFMPVEYAKSLRRWCTRHQALLIWDEIQAGFGRTGAFWGFEHYEDAVPDLMCLGKGISSGMPVSAVIGRSDVMDLYGPGEMTSTHTGNPVCAAAALASIEILLAENLTRRARELGEILQAEVCRIGRKHPSIGHVDGKGLVAAIQMVTPGTKDPDHPLAHRIIELCFYRGLLMFAPVGLGGGAIKICPPLCIHEDQLREGIGVLEEAIDDACRESRANGS